jgi:DNA-binding transcriptional MerR regulator
MEPHREKPAGTRRMKISQAARAAGVSVQTVEYYILLGLLKPIRQPGKRGRWFSGAHVKRIRLIRQLNASGYTLQALRETYLRRR